MSRDLRGAYEGDCRAKGRKPISQGDFGNLIKEVFPKSRYRTMGTTAYRYLVWAA